MAVKVENNPVAYPLSGLAEAEVVYEELVEGGITRFMAIYHCTDSSKVGPVRSSRIVDAAIMRPITGILAAAGGNAQVIKALKKAGIFIVDERTGAEALRRVSRPGVSFEHTLYGNTAKIRKIGMKKYEAPPSNVFNFGDLQKAKKVKSVNISFSGATTVGYRWTNGKWARFDDGDKLMDDSGKQIMVDNVLIEEHRVNESKTIRDVAGNPSIEIADPTGRGRAVLFRDGRAVVGKWVRKSEKEPVRFETRSGEEMALEEGTTWIELVPSNKGQVKGSFSFK